MNYQFKSQTSQEKIKRLKENSNRIKIRIDAISDRFPTEENVLELFLKKNNLPDPSGRRNIGNVLVVDFPSNYLLLSTKKGISTQGIEPLFGSKGELGYSSSSRIYCGEYHTKNQVYQLSTEFSKGQKFQREKQIKPFPEKWVKTGSPLYSVRRLDKNTDFWFLDDWEFSRDSSYF